MLGAGLRGGAQAWNDSRSPQRNHWRRPALPNNLQCGSRAAGHLVALSPVPFRSAVRDITPIQQGVRYQQTFDQLWHYLFGIANQKLVEGELFVNPYAEGRPQQGYTAFIYEDGLNLGW